MQSILVLWAILLGLIVVNAVGIVLVRKHNIDDVRTIWYFYSLSTMVSIVLLIWAVSDGAIAFDGTFTKSHHGILLGKIQDCFFDFPADAALVGAIVCISFVPQVLTYALCAPFGCASTPWLVGWAPRIFVWGIVKSFVVVSGIATAWAFGDLYFSKPINALFEFVGAVVSISAAVITLVAYQNVQMALKKLASGLPPHILDLLRWAHRWACRHDEPAG